MRNTFKALYIVLQPQGSRYILQRDLTKETDSEKANRKEKKRH